MKGRPRSELDGSFNANTSPLGPVEHPRLIGTLVSHS